VSNGTLNLAQPNRHFYIKIDLTFVIVDVVTKMQLGPDLESTV